jgi:glycosyltransferase involved in cell wall biosynthesis
VPNRTGFCIHPVLTQAEYQSLGVAEKALPELVYDPVSDSLVTPRAISPDQLADAIWQLAQSPEQRATLAQDAVLMSRQRFSMEGYIQKFHALLTERR